MIIEIEGIKYNLELNGEGKPMVCIHGFSENLGTWEHLQIPGYRLVLIDLVGHGQSDKPKRRKYYNLKVMLRHLHKLLLQLGLKQYSMLGYSMGGRIALAYALAYPEEIDRLVLESASYGECGLKIRLNRRRDDMKLARNIEKNGIEWFNQYWSGLGIFESQKRLPEEVRDEIGKRRLANATHALANTLVGTGQGKFPCLKNKLVRLAMPVLYISGEYDKKYCKAGKDIKRLNTGIRHAVMTGCGHNTHIEDPDTFNKIIKQFLEEQ